MSSNVKLKWSLTFEWSQSDLVATVNMLVMGQGHINHKGFVPMWRKQVQHTSWNNKESENNYDRV